ncbi:acyltransferase [Dyella subtropica]|uniref:LpxL/LpxP family acyltransferase n=1 Tax=Dyella subtropica TaxID=2992127 RepID=UPI002250CFB4|nr:acyltransferase [Dyella subtropica]
MTKHWQSRPEGGGRFALWLIRSIGLHGGRRFARLFLYPITLYFYWRRKLEREASRHYLEKVLLHRVTAWQVMKHIHSFASTMLDRVFLLAHGEKDFDIETEGVDVLIERIGLGRGVLLFGSHQGSFEALRALASRRPDVSLRVLLDKQKTPALTELLEALAPDIGDKVIDASKDGATMALQIAEACEQGAMVALLADRGREHEVLRRADLLGQPAPFPVSPWLLAHTLKVPVVLCFGLYLGGNRYRLIFEPFADRVDIPRHDRAQALDAVIGRYAQRVEHYIRIAPYNWFNFYDFWQQDSHATARPEPAVVGDRIGG